MMKGVSGLIKVQYSWFRGIVVFVEIKLTLTNLIRISLGRTNKLSQTSMNKHADCLSKMSLMKCTVYVLIVLLMSSKYTA